MAGIDLLDVFIFTTKRVKRFLKFMILLFSVYQMCSFTAFTKIGELTCNNPINPEI